MESILPEIEFVSSLESKDRYTTQVTEPNLPIPNVDEISVTTESAPTQNINPIVETDAEAYSREGEENTEDLPELDDISLLASNGPEPTNEIEQGTESYYELYDKYGNPVPINYITPITINSPYPYVQTHVHIPAPDQIFNYVKHNRPTRNSHQQRYGYDYGRSYSGYNSYDSRSRSRPIDWQHINGLIQRAQGLSDGYDCPYRRNQNQVSKLFFMIVFIVK